MKNDTRKDDFLKDVAEWGRDRSKGDDSMCKVFVGCVKGVQEGFLSQDKDSDGVTDLDRVYDRYGKAKSKRVFGDKKLESDASLKSQKSKLNVAFKLGALNSKGIDPYGMISNAAEIHKSRYESGLVVKGAYTAIVDVGRTQLASDTELTDDEIIAAVTPKDGPDKTVESVAKQAHRILDRLITGEAGVPFVCDDDVRGAIINAEEQLRGALALMTKRREVAEKRAQFEALKAELEPEQIAA